MSEVRYHISPESGRPNICRASSPEKCDYAQDGVAPPHFSSKEAARKHYEKENSGSTFSNSLSKKKEKKSRKNSAPETVAPVEEVFEEAEEDITPIEDLDIDPDMTELEDVDLDDNEIVISDDDDYNDDEGCDHCGEDKPDVRSRRDPYELSKGNTVWRNLCDECEEDLESY